MKVEIRIFATKDVALDQFKEHFFGRKESFYLKNSENWLKYMLSLYADTGLGPFLAIKVSSKPDFSKCIFDIKVGCSTVGEKYMSAKNCMVKWFVGNFTNIQSNYYQHTVCYIPQTYI